MTHSKNTREELLHKVEDALYIYFRMISMSTYPWKGMELTQLEMQMLVRLDKLEHSSVTELAKMTEVTKGGVSLFISKLAKKGLVSKTRDTANASRVILSLSEEGQAVVEEFRQFHLAPNRFFMDYLQSLDDREFEVVGTFTERLTEWLCMFRDSLPESPKNAKYCRQKHSKNVPKTEILKEE
ncbi:MarR family winged helix-turn-helix transcriptional regulator [Desulfobaculum bizertense]|uniref:DNA-binding transcriptional regulator, MarR family n=1 Tax=Desulfobaculum bizertense DSM 18034 TaxID=1121442 RepID=A0A1T4VYX1_9BACT|nr:MarR family transcriptional regulator [Desulfobaculum bizertense]UIJ36998.1 MarR family transcriptional regulator [Desulfobaculum bizertense]SKA70127.1 DNA-binding transcriptional regulator, MarR family [Desulfobaculum bizertense DSM 18034]